MVIRTGDWPVTFSALEALTWIAFRRFVPGGLWTDLPETRPKWDWHVVQQAEWEADGLKTIWIRTAPALIAALEARATRSPQPVKSRPFLHGAWRYRAAARRLVRSTGLEAMALAEELRRDLEVGVSAEKAIDAACISLCRALAEGHVKAIGIRTEDRTEIPIDRPSEKIKRIYFSGNSKLTIDFDGFTESTNEVYTGPFWGCIEIWRAELRDVFPDRGIQSRGSGSPRVNGGLRSSSTAKLDPSPSKRPRSSGLDYRQADASLVEEALAMLKDGRAKNVNDAARALAHRAIGSATEDSRRKRLIQRIQEAIGQTGQS